MSVPVTTRLAEDVVEALDAAVSAGAVPNRGAAVQEAVRQWLSSHGEAAIAASYRRRYQGPDPAHDDLLGRLGEYSLKACLAAGGG